jgi:hypothetical protein
MDGVRWEGEALHVQEVLPFFEDASPRVDALWKCQVRHWKAGVVVENDYFALSVPMRLRAGSLAVLEQQIVEVLSVAVHDSAPVPRPALEVPIFSQRFLPRAAVSPELERAIEAMCFIARDDEED